MSAVDFASIKDALAGWLIASTGLAPDRIVFGGQNIARPLGDLAWVGLQILRNDRWGRAFVLQSANPSPTPGAEVLTQVVNWRKLTVEVTVYPPADVTDATEALAFATEACARAELPGQLQAFRAAGIGMLTTEHIVVSGGVIGSTQIESKAAFMLSFTVPSSVIETTTYIDTVNASITTSNPTITLPITIDLE